MIYLEKTKTIEETRDAPTSGGQFLLTFSLGSLRNGKDKDGQRDKGHNNIRRVIDKENTRLSQRRHNHSIFCEKLDLDRTRRTNKSQSKNRANCEKCEIFGID